MEGNKIQKLHVDILYCCSINNIYVAIYQDNRLSVENNNTIMLNLRLNHSERLVVDYGLTG